MSKNTFGNLLVAAGLSTLPKPANATKPRPAAVRFFSFTGNEGSRFRVPFKRSKHANCPPGLYRKVGTQEIVRVCEQAHGRVYFVPVSCGVTNVDIETQDDADSLAAEVFCMAYKPCNPTDTRKA